MFDNVDPPMAQKRNGPGHLTGAKRRNRPCEANVEALEKFNSGAPLQYGRV